MLSYDVLFKPQLLYQLLLRCPWKVVGVGEIKKLKTKKRKNKKKSLNMIIFWGIKGTFFLIAHILIQKLFSAISVPSYIRSRSTIKKVCKLFSINYNLVDNVNDINYIKYLEALKIDVIVSFQHQIFKNEILKVPKITCINCHPSKLPKYRGIKPIFWAMLNNDDHFGITVHSMEKKIDTGIIINQQCFKNSPNSTLVDNYVKAYSLSVDVILKSLDIINENRQLEKLPKIESSSLYYKEPQFNDLIRFKKLGLKII